MGEGTICLRVAWFAHLYSLPLLEASLWPAILTTQTLTVTPALSTSFA
jgi:hypothetical protein